MENGGSALQNYDIIKSVTKRVLEDSFMKKRSCLFAYFCACVSALVLLMSVFPRTALADEEYTSTTMRLLHYEGTVGIEDASGKQRPVMENARLGSGEAMKTGEASTASVGLDKGRVCTLDALSRVERRAHNESHGRQNLPRCE